MSITFQAVVLDTSFDSQGLLVFRDGRLVAVVSRLDPYHDQFAGHWHIEKTFCDWSGPFETYCDLATLERRLQAVLDGSDCGKSNGLGLD